MKTKNILIVGGSGALGSYLINYINKNSNIFILDKKKFKEKKNIKFIKFDFLKKNKLNNIPKKIDTVFFFAGMIGGTQSVNIDNFNNYFKFNCLTLINFLEITDNCKIKKIIFTSTEHVYGDNENLNNNKTLIEPNPKNFYGLTKLLSEKLLFNYFEKKKVSIDILRFPRVIYEYSDNFIKILIEKIINKKQVLIDNPNLDFNLIYIDDLINALKKCMIKNKKKVQILDIFNDSNPISMLEIIKIIKESLKTDIKVKNLNKKLYNSHNPFKIFITNKNSKKELNWKPKFNNIEIITKILNTYEFSKDNE